MTEERQQELKKLLVSNDFKMETYMELDMQEIIILRNTALSLQKENAEEGKDENAAKFFEGKAKFLYAAVLEKLKVLDEMFVIFSLGTKMPYVTCDAETFNDQIWVYTREMFAQNDGKLFQQKNYPIQIVKFTKEQFLPFYINLFPMGINAIVVDHGVNALELQLEELCKRPDYSNAPKEQVPIQNQELHLTALYFMQELRRQVDSSEKKNVKELEEEVMVNLSRGTYLLPIQFMDLKEGEEAPKVIAPDAKNVRVPFLKFENEGSYQPIFTDPSEFHKFNKEKKFKAITVPYENLGKVIAAEAKGIVVNPMGFNLMLNRQHIEPKGEA